MELNPVPVLMAIVIYSNIGGSITPVGDPPNVIIASNQDVIDSVRIITPLKFLPTPFVALPQISILYKPEIFHLGYHSNHLSIVDTMHECKLRSMYREITHTMHLKKILLVLSFSVSCFCSLKAGLHGASRQARQVNKYLAPSYLLRVDILLLLLLRRYSPG
jgi:di/tricarboxylate transporter